MKTLNELADVPTRDEIDSIIDQLDAEMGLCYADGAEDIAKLLGKAIDVLSRVSEIYPILRDSKRGRTE